MIRIDALGDACPIPVIKTKRALSASLENETIQIYVDNEIATQNLSKMASQMGLSCTVKQHSNKEYSVDIVKGRGSEYVVKPAIVTSGSLVVVGSSAMGSGDEALGKNLMKAFIYTLTELQPPPATLVFYNSGAFLSASGSNAMEDLRNLETLGTRILTCGACLSFYNLSPPAVGQVTNMLEIVELMHSSTNIIKP